MHRLKLSPGSRIHGLLIALALGLLISGCRLLDILSPVIPSKPRPVEVVKNDPCYKNPECIDGNYFRDTIIHYLTLKCASCHFNNTIGGASANLVFDTSLDVTNPTSLADRYSAIYKNIVNAPSFIRPTISPTIRVVPRDTNNSLFYQSLTMTDEKIARFQRDNIPDSLQYKLSTKMPPFGLWGEVTTDDPLPTHPMITAVRKWIVAGAPGPGDLSNIEEKTIREGREKFVRDSIEQRRILDSLLNALNSSEMYPDSL